MGTERRSTFRGNLKVVRSISRAPVVEVADWRESHRSRRRIDEEKEYTFQGSGTPIIIVQFPPGVVNFGFVAKHERAIRKSRTTMADSASWARGKWSAISISHSSRLSEYFSLMNFMKFHNVSSEGGEERPPLAQCTRVHD